MNRHYKKKQLKFLVIASFVLVFVIWVIWIATGAWSSRRHITEVNLFGDILDTSQSASAEFNTVKQKINDNLEKIKAASQTVKQQTELVNKIKEKIDTAASSTPTSPVEEATTTATTSQISN